jgi:hypothetical protein
MKVGFKNVGHALKAIGVLGWLVLALYVLLGGR